MVQSNLWLPCQPSIIHVLWVIIYTFSQRSIFLTACSGTHVHCNFYQITIIYSLSFDIVHVRYLVFICEGNFSASLQPLQVYVRHWYVVTPSVNNFISQSHPLTFSFKGPYIQLYSIFISVIFWYCHPIALPPT
jgi:hypothetical protein